MKWILSKIVDFLSWILACFAGFILVICLLFLLPFDYIKYKRSPYYKTKRKKYKAYAGSGTNFEIYNEIIKNNLPIKYIYNPNNDSLESGWFVYGNILIIPNVFSFEYDSETEKWNYCCYIDEDDESEKRIIMSLDEYMENEVNEANELAGTVICDKAIVLIDAEQIDNVDLAKKEKSFLVYDNNREEILKSFCANTRMI